MYLKAILLASIIIVSIFVSSAQAVPSLVATRPITGTYGNFITVELVGSCLTLAKANLTSTSCPTYRDLQVFDTTNQKISGKFFDDNGFYHRGKPMYKNYQLSYQKADYPWVVCVDCSKQIMMQSKQIIVKGANYHYTLNTDSKIINNTRNEYSQRFVDGCMTATIAYSDFLLNDTINYLKSGCTETNFKEKTTIIKPYIKHDISTSKAYKDQKWLEAAKKLAKTNCLKSTEC